MRVITRSYHKKRSIPYIIVLIVFLFLLHNEVSSQYAFRKQWTFNVNSGLCSYYGSFSEYKADPIRKFMNESRLGIGVSLSKHITPIVQVRTDFLTGGLASEKRDSSEYYQGSFLEFNINGRLNVINVILGENEERKGHIYLMLGAGVSIINSGFYNIRNEENILIKEPQEVISTRLVIPFGIAFSYKLSKNLDLTLDVSRRLLKTQILDTDFDYYNYTAIGLNYNFDFPRNFRLNFKPKRYAYVEHSDKELEKYMKKKKKWRRNPGPLVKKHYKKRPKIKIGG